MGCGEGGGEVRGMKARISRLVLRLGLSGSVPFLFQEYTFV